MDATVVGGGIAGLASAVSLRRAGWQVHVLERAPVFGEVGAGLAVTANGMSALGAIGVDAAARSAGHQVRAAGYQDHHGRWLLRMPTEPAGTASATTFVGIHRQRLHAALRQAAEAEGAALTTGAEVTSVHAGEPGGAPARVTWRNGPGERTAGADLVVAADGVRSRVRAQLFPGARPAYTGATCWRAVVSDSGHDDRLVQLLGPGTEFGMLRISSTELFWYGQFQHPQDATFDDELATAHRHFAGWPTQVRAAVAATTPDHLIRHDVYHLPGGLPSYTHGRVVVVGDAAHAMQNTSGQGAASAIEDGVCVGAMIAAPVAAGSPLAAALAEFDRARRSRCRKLARLALTTARLGYELDEGWRQSLRNTIARLVPASLATRAAAGVTRWTPPTTPPAAR